jgi:hypothetical protein
VEEARIGYITLTISDRKHPISGSSAVAFVSGQAQMAFIPDLVLLWVFVMGRDAVISAEELCIAEVHAPYSHTIPP